MRNAKYAATRMTMSIGAAVLVVMATVVPVASASSSDVPPPDKKTALIMGGTSIPTWNDADVEVIMRQFIAPTHPDQTIEPVAVTTPEEWWPLTGLIRLTCAALGPPSLCGPGGAAWPDEPLWKLSGLFDLTMDQSVRAGVADLEDAMADSGNDHLVIYGFSQGAVIAIREKRKLAEQYPGPEAPDIDFVLSGDLNLPNGGLYARFPGLYIPILDWSFNGPEPTDTQFDTVVITRQYDFFADFPLYPLNVISLLNAVLGAVYVHPYALDVSLAPDPTTPPPIHTETGDTDYYFFPTEDLPLFAPLRTLGVPESLIDVVEPFFRVIVELGYDRSIKPWEPTPARLIPTLDPATVTTDLANAIGEGINNAAALIGLPPLLSIPAAPDTEDATADVSQQTTWTAESQQITSMVELSPAEGNPADDLDTTFERKTADDPAGSVERNPADDLDTTFERNPADDLDTTFERNPADGVEETASRGTQQTTSRGTSSGTRLTTTSRQFHRMASTGTTPHRQRTSTGALSTAASSSAGSSPTPNSARVSADSDYARGSADSDSIRGSDNGDAGKS